MLPTTWPGDKFKYFSILSTVKMQEFRLPGSSICKVSCSMQNAYQDVHISMSWAWHIGFWVLPLAFLSLCLFSVSCTASSTSKVSTTNPEILPSKLFSTKDAEYPSVCWSPPQAESQSPANSIQLKLMIPVLPLKTYPLMLYTVLVSIDAQLSTQNKLSLPLPSSPTEPSDL